MYAKINSNVTFFKDSNNENTEKCVYGRISEGFNTGHKDDNGRDIYEYESWNARFVGKALDKAKALEDKTSITIKECNFRNPYVQEKKRSYPYILITDFDIREKNANA